MKLLHKRWVSKEEKKQLREEYSTYHSIRIIGYLLIVLTLFIFFNIGEIYKDGIIAASLAVIYGFVMLAAGIGLIKFRRFARNIALFVFLSFIVLPFTPLFSDDKGAPLMIILSLSGLYYLLGKTARKIFSSPAGSNPEDTKQNSSVLRKAIYAGLLLLAFFMIYFVYDLIQAKRLAADACKHATEGKPLEDFLSEFSEKDYKIIRGADYIMLVPKRGMGRNHCTVTHDGQNITGSKAGFND